MAPVIETHQLRKQFDATVAVKNVDLTVAAGEIFGIIGPDGAGKTTLLRMLAGIMIPTSGDARVLDYRLPLEAEGLKEHLGYMSQKFNLYPDLTVEENIRFFGDVFGIPRATLTERLEPLMRMTRLEPFIKRLAGNLSGGMKQKLALMCTLIHRPKLLLLDEPTTGVDPVSRREFWEILYEILREGVTIVITTPYMDEAEWCTRIGLMFGGSFVSTGTPKTLKSGLAGTVAEIAPHAPSPELSRRIREIPGVRDVQIFGTKYHALVTGEAAVKKLVDALSGTAEVRAVAPSIEDIFVDTIEKLK